MGNDPADKLAPPKLGFRRSRAKKERTPPAAEAAVRAPEPPEPPREPLAVDAEPTRRLPSLAVVKERLTQKTPSHSAPEAAAERDEEETPHAPRRPLLTGHPAAAVTGLVVGLFLVLAVWGAERVSESTRNTSSLGKAGFPLLLGIFIIAVVGGALLLRRCAVPSPGSVSFLGTALVAVLTILFLTNYADTRWAAAVVVALTVASFVLARWVTVRYIDTE